LFFIVLVLFLEVLKFDYIAALEQKEILTNTPTECVFVDKDYRGYSVSHCNVYISGQKRNMTKSLKTKLKRRSAIEPTIGHMKTEGRLDRCTLKGQLGDAMFHINTQFQCLKVIKMGVWKSGVVQGRLIRGAQYAKIVNKWGSS
jgi:hypothetical protein